MIEPLRFTLTDGDGASHDYEVLPHNTDQGLAIVGRLMQAGIPALASAIGSAMAGGPAGVLGQIAALRAGGGTPDGLQALLASVDFAGLGDKLALAIPQLDIARLGPELMRHTMRTNADGKLVKLDSPVEFNLAYKANYWELIAACQKVIAHNRFLPRLGS